MGLSHLDPEQRFGDRAADYDRYRPRYPDALRPLFLHELGLEPGTEVADVGAGTGIFSELLLDLGCHVLALEPNTEMRRICEARLGDHPRAEVHTGSAEETGLDDASVDVVAAAQAFHWFDPERAQTELRRILRPEGKMVFVYNERRAHAPIMEDYHDVIQRFSKNRRIADYREQGLAKDIERFFVPAPTHIHELDNEQVLALEGLVGRLCSSSYLPNRDDPGFAPMRDAASAMFERHQKHGAVRLLYTTTVYWSSAPAG